jgi:PHP family Zn ribbon phosphoesterase
LGRTPYRLPFRSIIPLSKFLLKPKGGSKFKKSGSPLPPDLAETGTELDILLEVPLDEIEKSAGKTLAEAIRRMRNRELLFRRLRREYVLLRCSGRAR